MAYEILPNSHGVPGIPSFGGAFSGVWKFIDEERRDQIISCVRAVFRRKDFLSDVVRLLTRSEN